MQTLAKDYSLPVVEGRPQLAVIHKGKAFVMPASKAGLCCVGPENLLRSPFRLWPALQSDRGDYLPGSANG